MKKIVVLILGVLILSSCTQMLELRDQLQSREAKYVVHTVRFPGESYSLISLWYTGDMDNWRTIQRYNPGVRARDIKLDSKIRIPLKLARKDRSYEQQEFYRLAKVSFRVKRAKQPVRVVAQTPPDQGVEPSPTGYYPVKTISGCEHFENSSVGLESCASLLESKLELR